MIIGVVLLPLEIGLAWGSGVLLAIGVLDDLLVQRGVAAPSQGRAHLRT